VQKLSPPKPV